MQIDFTSSYAPSQSTPKSRPLPECLTPPNGMLESIITWLLTHNYACWKSKRDRDHWNAARSPSDRV